MRAAPTDHESAFHARRAPDLGINLRIVKAESNKRNNARRNELEVRHESRVTRVLVEFRRSHVRRRIVYLLDPELEEFRGVDGERGEENDGGNDKCSRSKCSNRAANGRMSVGGDGDHEVDAGRHRYGFSRVHDEGEGGIVPWWRFVLEGVKVGQVEKVKGEEERIGDREHEQK